MLDDSFKVIGLINYHASNYLRSSCMTHDCRDRVVSALCPDVVAPSEKEDKVPTQIPERNLPPRPTPPQQQETKPQSDYIVKAQKLV